MTKNSPIKTHPIRRHDVDWLRVGALMLLIIYHSLISFQPWSVWFRFIQNEETLDFLWVFMEMINIWRIPILFFISGMGVYFALRRRSWKELVKDRTLRILVPLVFGSFFVCSITEFFAQKHFGEPIKYTPNPGHLWFLFNIYLYVLFWLPLLIYFKKHPKNLFFSGLARLMGRTVGILVVPLIFVLYALLISPEFWSLYAYTAHGVALGAVCFISGYIVVAVGDPFWEAAEKLWFSFLFVSFGLYLFRLFAFVLNNVPAPSIIVALESSLWLLGIFGAGSRFLNKPSRALNSLSKAVYPLYIVHMPILFTLCFVIVPLEMPPIIKWGIALSGTFYGSWALYAFVLRRSRWVRPFFGMKI
tara:strand:- start:52825 stop:53904 length:1080 start_codon:yes stop_codon:yes gene_type:complete